ncbi:MAG: carbohydrate kinase [Bacteroidia bacterium]|nr:carbohydrate kinase [Bacteroidia bacterium]
MYAIGYDIGSSSVKASIIRSTGGSVVATAKYPDQEFEIIAHQTGWAEQDPAMWWDAICKVTQRLLSETDIKSKDIESIGIAYQMHGLVLIDKEYQVLRPSIIWCDSRAVDIGNQAFKEIGEQHCLSHLLNPPGNFTAAKLKWVKDHEPDIYKRIHKILLPGDYINLQLTGKLNTTISGMSEGIFWDFQHNAISKELMDYFGFSDDHIPNVIPSFSIQGKVSAKSANATGLTEGTLVTYRAGDQPNNAMSLGVMDPGEVAATGGTSGVVYGVVERPVYDRLGRVNCFAHVNHTKDQPRIGVLLCINGAGILYSWLRQHIAKEGASFDVLEDLIQSIPPGSQGLRIIPFGNGAERMLQNENPRAQVNNLQFNIHTRAHMIRAGLEGVAFAFVYGLEIMQEIGLQVSKIRVGNDNLFQSASFSSIIADLSGCELEIVNTTGAVGAARASRKAIGARDSDDQLAIVMTYYPKSSADIYTHAYNLWKQDLEHLLTKTD